MNNLEANFSSVPSRQPVLVSEGTSAQKMARIRRSVYLTYALQSLSDNISDTVIFGANFGDQDAHIADAIGAGAQRSIAISVRRGSRAKNESAMARYRAKFPSTPAVVLRQLFSPTGRSVVDHPIVLDAGQHYAPELVPLGPGN